MDPLSSNHTRVIADCTRVIESHGGGNSTPEPANRRGRSPPGKTAAKRAPGDARPEEDVDHAVRQIISRAVAPEGVIDLFAAAGLARPDISILSEEFLAEVRGMRHRNLAEDMHAACARGDALRLSEGELAFYDALETNDSADRSWATRRCGPARRNWSRPCAPTSRSTGRCARASGLSSECS